MVTVSPRPDQVYWIGIATDEASNTDDHQRRGMASCYSTPASGARAELLAINSRFVAAAGPASGVEAAKSWLRRTQS